MKVNNKIIILLACSLIVIILSGCSQYNFDEVPADPFAGTKLEANYTIKELTERFVNPNEKYSSNRIDSAEELIINGIITSTDFGGNVYKYIVIQEEFPGGRAIRISVDAAGVSSIYQIGRRVSVKLKGLYIGNYGRVPQIGTYNERPQDGRIQPGMMPYSEAKKHIFPYGYPDKESVVADTMTITDILNADRLDLNYRLVCIKNAWFTGRGANFNKPADIANPADMIFAPGTNGVGFPQSREIQDATGSLFVSTSEYAKFAKQPLPNDSIVGNITAIVTWYNTSDSSPEPGEIYHQLTLRTLNDLGDGFEEYHASLNPEKTEGN